MREGAAMCDNCMENAVVQERLISRALARGRGYYVGSSESKTCMGLHF